MSRGAVVWSCNCPREHKVGRGCSVTCWRCGLSSLVNRAPLVGHVDDLKMSRERFRELWAAGEAIAKARGDGKVGT